MGLQKVSLPGSRRDTILLSFADAKLSVVEYDPANHDLKSVSLHIFEDDESKGLYFRPYFIRAYSMNHGQVEINPSFLIVTLTY